MRIRLSALMMMIGSVAVHAQSGTKGPQPVSAPSSRPRVGYAASPPPEPAPVRPPPYGFGNYIVTGAPYVAMGDGSIVVNFGNGYQRTLRQCATQTSPVNNYPNGRDALGRIGPPPGIAALQQGTRGQLGGTMPAVNVNACYRHDGRGHAEIVHQ